jgi:hypothetical protein
LPHGSLSQVMRILDHDGVCVPWSFNFQWVWDSHFGRVLVPHTLCPLCSVRIVGFHNDSFCLLLEWLWKRW